MKPEWAVAREVVARARRLSLTLCVGVSLAWLCPTLAFGQAQGTAVAKAVSVQGTVEARRAGQPSWQPVRLNDTYAPGDVIRVGERSRADLAMLDQSVLRLNANTELTIEQSHNRFLTARGWRTNDELLTTLRWRM